jgi:nucleoside-diphosphate-sugar epimerase
MTTDEAKEAGPAPAYLVSKVIAERAAFDFVKDEKPQFTVSTICPPMVYGPLRHAVDSMDKLNTSSKEVYDLYNGSADSVRDTAFYAFCDVRTLAQAHFRAYESEKAAGQRYLTSDGPYTFQWMANIIRDKFPELKDGTPEGKPAETLPDVYRLDCSKVQKELGIEFYSLEQTVVDTVNSLRELEKSLEKK